MVPSEIEPRQSDFGEPSVMGSFAGRYSLSDLRDGRGERRVFQCRAVNISPRGIALAAPVKGKIGDRVIVHLNEFGKLQGAISKLLENGFVIKIAASEEERNRLAAKIEWLDDHKNCEAPNRRSDRRTVPVDPCSKIILSDGKVETCLVIDLSVSGAAISSDTIPDVGAVLAIGRVVCRVVRHFVGGFAVRFIERQNEHSVEAMLILK